MIRLPSVVLVIQSARETLRRFPWVLLSAFLSACICWVLAVHSSAAKSFEETLSRLLLSSLLGIASFFGLALWLERSSWSALRHWIGLLAGVLLLGCYYLSYDPDAPQVYSYRFWQLAVASHLLVAVSPYLRSGEMTGFWEFNRTLFQRILLAVLFSTVLYAGLAIALWAIQSLLGLKVDWKIYYFFFLAVAFLFNTWFFLAGVSANWRELDEGTEYPSGLRLFVQFILLPLVTIYVLILYAYLFKILAIREWPRGTIGWLVSVMSAAGMLSLLLVHPLRDQPSQRWIRLYSRWFYGGLFPLIVLLLMAIWRRVSEYGLTEERYFLIILTFWITGIAGYFTFGRQPSIKVIPASLALLAILSVAGPWGAYHRSLASQLGRLSARLERVGILKNGRIEKARSPVGLHDRKEISAAVRYLLHMHGTTSLKAWFSEDLKSLWKDEGPARTGFFWRQLPSEPARKITEMMGVTYLESWEGDPKHFSASVRRDWQSARSVAGYDYLIRVSLYRSPGGTSSQALNIAGRKCELTWSSNPQSVELREGKHLLTAIDAAPFMNRLYQHTGQQSASGLPEEVMTLEAESSLARVRLVFESISGERNDSNIQLTNAHGELFVKFHSVIESK